MTKRKKRPATFHWNHRVLRRVYNAGESSEEIQFAIHECYYDDEEPGPDEVPGSCTMVAIDPVGETLEELRETLTRMLAPPTSPVLDYDTIGSGKQPAR